MAVIWAADSTGQKVSLTVKFVNGSINNEVDANLALEALQNALNRLTVQELGVSSKISFFSLKINPQKMDYIYKSSPSKQKMKQQKMERGRIKK